jgi:DNA modification methylase
MAKKPKTLQDLIPDDRNANRGTERGMGMLEASLREYGAGRSVLLDKHGKIIAGNKTVETAVAIGLDRLIVVPSDGRSVVAVQRTDLDLDSDPKARELALADNRVSEVDLQWDPEVLADLGKDIDLAPFFTREELAELLGETLPVGEAPEPQLDRAEELQKEWETCRGQLWEIPSTNGPGRAHRLLCGDSTKECDVARLWANPPKDQPKAAMLATDPPYGVAYGVDSGPDSAKRFGDMTGDAADGPKLQAFLESVFMAALPYLRDDAAWYLWHAQLTQGFFAAAAAAAAAAQLLIHRQIIWVKNHFILGHGDYHWQHELCFYGWRQGHRARWFGDRTHSTTWNIDRPSAATTHPTEKPAELFYRSMMVSTMPEEICFEPFAGSGTQFCAAEQARRLCFGLEIEPNYVAVSLQRLRDMGLKPRLLDDGKVPDVRRRANGRANNGHPPGRKA